MSTFVYECDTCSVVDEYVQMSIEEYTPIFPCGATPECPGRMRRVWHKIVPRINRVANAGNSPAR